MPASTARGGEVARCVQIAPWFYFYLRKVEAEGTLTRVETADNSAAEDFAQILQRLKDHYGVSDSEIARRTGVHVSTVNSWVHRKRVPRPDAIDALAAAFPVFSREELHSAAGRKTPGPLSPDAEQRIMQLIKGLTKEQQEITEIQLRALNDANRS